MHEARSELESFILGLIWKHGPISVYGIRLLLRASPSTHWSGSAGSIYPLIKRLDRDGLLVAEPHTQGRRKSLRFSVSPAGIEEIRRWIGPPLPKEAVSVVFDPLRSRMRFLGLLDRQERLEWIDHAIRRLEEVRDRVDQWDAANEDAFSRLVTAHGRKDVVMRTQWLMEAKKTLSEGQVTREERG